MNKEDSNSCIPYGITSSRKRTLISSFLLESFSNTNVIDFLPQTLQKKKVELVDYMHSLDNSTTESLYSIYISENPEKKKSLLRFIQRAQHKEYRAQLPQKYSPAHTVNNSSFDTFMLFLKEIKKVVSRQKTVPFDLSEVIYYLKNPTDDITVTDILDGVFCHEIENITKDSLVKLDQIISAATTRNDSEFLTKLINLKRICALRSTRISRFNKTEFSVFNEFYKKSRNFFQKAAVFLITATVGASIYADIHKNLPKFSDNIRANCQVIQCPQIDLSVLSRKRKIVFITDSGIRCISKFSFTADSFKIVGNKLFNHARTILSPLKETFQNFQPSYDPARIMICESPDLPKISDISKEYMTRVLASRDEIAEKKDFIIDLNKLNRTIQLKSGEARKIENINIMKSNTAQVYIGFWKNSRSRFKNHTATHVGYLILNGDSIDVLHARGRKIVVENITSLDTYKLKTVVCLDVNEKQYSKFKEMVKKYDNRVRYYQRNRCARFVWRRARDCGFAVPQNDAWNQRKWYLRSVDTELNGKKSPKYEILYDFRLTNRELKKNGPLFGCLDLTENNVCLN